MRRSHGVRQAIALVCGNYVGMQSIAMLPLLVQQTISALGTSEHAAAALSGVQLGAGAIAALLLSQLASRVNLKSAYFVGVMLAASGNAFSLIALHFGSFALLLLSRAYEGLGEGIALASVNALAAGTERPLRSYGIMTAGFGAIVSVAYLLVPRLIHAFGAQALFAAMMLSGVTSLLVTPLLPATRTDLDVTHRGARRGFTAGETYALLGYTLFMLVAGGTWALSQRVGAVSAHLDNVTLGNITSVAAALIFVGPLVGTVVCERVGISMPLLVTCASYIGVVTAFAFLGTSWLFSLALIAHAVISSFMNTVTPTYLAEVDPSGRAPAAAAAFVPLGAAFGPPAMSLARSGFPGFHGLAYVGTPLLIIATLFLILSLGQQARVAAAHSFRQAR